MIVPAPRWYIGGRWLSLAIFTVPLYSVQIGVGDYIAGFTLGRVPEKPPFPPTQPE